MSDTITTFHSRIEEGPTAAFCGPEWRVNEWRRDLPPIVKVLIQKRMTVLIPADSKESEVHALADWVFEWVLLREGDLTG